MAQVNQDHKMNRVDLYVEHSPGVRFPCPVCEGFCSVYDHTAEREVRHLNVCQMKTYLHVRVPRVSCCTHGVQQIVHGLSDPNGTVTYGFEELILELEQECSIESVCRILDTDWHLCQSLQERAVERGFSRKPPGIPKRMGVDEKSFAKGHKYETIVYDIDAGTVAHVCDNREQASLESYYRLSEFIEVL
jgi:transposase